MSLLNSEQKKAVETIEGPLLIIAGPGSGKTRTLIERMVYMIEVKKIDVKNILITTFTEKSAKEIKSRLLNRFKADNFHIEDLYIGTVHSICLKIIDENIEYSSFKKDYKILDEMEQKLLIFSNFKEFKKLKSFESYISENPTKKTWQISSELAKWFNKFNEEALLYPTTSHFFGEAFYLYRNLLLNNGTMDFSTIQCEAYQILKNNENVLSKVQEEIKYLMIDEYQDTNSIQEKILFLLAGKNENICVVGDDDQGLYRFRGATIKNILTFHEKTEKKCEIIRLETNYRSSKDIVSFCNKWINSLHWENFRHDKSIKSVYEDEEHETRVVKLSTNKNLNHWLERVSKFLKFLLRSNLITDYNQVAFLFKSVKHHYVKKLIFHLEKEGINVYSPRSNIFFEREEIKIIIGLFVYILTDEERKLNDKEYKDDIFEYYISCENIVKKILLEDEILKNEIDEIKNDYKDITKKNMGNLLDLYYKILSTKYFKFIYEEESEFKFKDRKKFNLGIFSKIISQVDNISKIRNITNENIKKITNYFFNMHLKYLKKSGVNEYENVKDYAPTGCVSFMTIHQAKGLEFPVVVVDSLDSVPNEPFEEERELEKKLIPTEYFEPEHRKEEFDFWRLYYTAFSRAKNLLVLTCLESNKTNKQVPSLPFKKLYSQIPEILEGVDFKTLDIEKTSSLDIMNTYSFTSDLLKFKENVVEYTLSKVYSFEKNQGLENYFGTLVHGILEFINKSYLKGNELSLDIIEEAYYSRYELLKKNGIIFSEIVLETGLNQIYDYYNEEYIKKNIVAAEKSYFALQDNYIIKGNIDLIIEEENNLKILDFKTGNSEISKDSMEKYVSQIKLYCYLLSENSSQKVIGGEIYFVKTKEKVFVPYEIGNEKNILKDFDEMVNYMENRV